MFQTIEAAINEHGAVRLLEPIHLAAARRALVVVLEDELTASVSEATYLSEGVPQISAGSLRAAVNRPRAAGRDNGGSATWCR